MIIEKRKHIRKLKPAESDWVPRPDYVEIEQWNEIRLPKITSKSLLLIKALVAGLIGYWLGAVFFLE